MLEETRQEAVLPEDRPRTFEAQAISSAIIIVLAGPAMNVLFPVLFYFAVLAGEESSRPRRSASCCRATPRRASCSRATACSRWTASGSTRSPSSAALIQKSPNKELKISVFRGNRARRGDDRPAGAEGRPQAARYRGDDRRDRHQARASPAAVIGVSKTDSPAYRAGLRTFDVVIEVRGKADQTFTEDLEAALAENRGETIPVAYLRPVRVHARARLDGGHGLVYESGVAALTPDVGPPGASARTGIGARGSLRLADVPEGSAEHKRGSEAGRQAHRGRRRRGAHVVDVRGQAVRRAREAAQDLVAARQGQPKSGVDPAPARGLGRRVRRASARASCCARRTGRPSCRSRRSTTLRAPDALRRARGDVRRRALIVVGIARIVEGRVSLSTLGGPITIYDVVGEEARKGVSYFVWAMGVISINLGLINLLPIPLLDGGHLLFFAFEAVLRKPAAAPGAGDRQPRGAPVLARHHGGRVQERRGAAVGRHREPGAGARRLSELSRPPALEPREAALATELTYGVLRTQGYLEARVAELARRGRGIDDALAQAHLLIGLYTLLFLERIPAFAAVSEAVGAISGRLGERPAGFANHVLRSAQKEVERAGRPTLEEAAVRGAPGWLRGALRRSLGRAGASDFLCASARPAPLCLAVRDPERARRLGRAHLRRRPERRVGPRGVVVAARDPGRARGRPSPAPRLGRGVDRSRRGGAGARALARRAAGRRGPRRVRRAAATRRGSFTTSRGHAAGSSRSTSTLRSSSG
jgi:regulator of sigma E protease